MKSTDSKIKFLAQLRESQLLDPEQLDEITRELLPQAKDPHALAQTLIRREWLTPFQVEQLFLGHHAELTVGPYRLLERVGQGGMGQVFKAQHMHLKRIVALKVIGKNRVSPDPDVIRRFQREARAAAQLSHPNAVTIYNTDQVGNTHFIAMQYVEGTTLHDIVKQLGPLPDAVACDYIRQAALGLQHIHKHGLVHRDIKPSNLIVAGPPVQPAKPSKGISGFRPHPAAFRKRSALRALPEEDRSEPAQPATGLPEGGVVKILDLGLARLVHSSPDSVLTPDGSALGTPDFIAPEQALNARHADSRADLYSLGCTFYFLLTGQPPFPLGSVMEKLMMHQLDQPQPVEEVRPKVAPAVREVVHKLMAKRPAERYQTAAELVEALTSVSSAGQSLPVPPRVERDLGHPAAPTFQRIAAPSTPLAKEEASPTHPDFMVVLEQASKLMVLKGHTRCVLSLAFSPDRETLASGDADGVVRLWDLSGPRPGQRAVLQAHQGGVRALVFARDNQTLASSSVPGDGQVKLWDLGTPRPQEKAVIQASDTGVAALTFSADGTMLATNGKEGTIWLWDVSRNAPTGGAVLQGSGGFIQAVAFAPDAKSIAGGRLDGSVSLWTFGKKLHQQQAIPQGHSAPVESVAFAPDGETLASGGLDETVRLWDLSNRKPVERAVLKGHQAAVRLVQFTPDGQTLVSVGDGGRVIWWDAASGGKRREWLLPRLRVSSVAVTFDGRYLAAGTSNGAAYVFRLAARETMLH